MYISPVTLLYIKDVSTTGGNAYIKALKDYVRQYNAALVDVKDVDRLIRKIAAKAEALHKENPRCSPDHITMAQPPQDMGVGSVYCWISVGNHSLLTITKISGIWL